MKYSAILLASALAACGSHNSPPPASADTVQAATNTPDQGPSFAPASADGVAAARSERNASTATGANTQTSAAANDTSGAASNANAANTAANQNGTTATAGNRNGSDASTGNAPSYSGNAAALPAQNPPTSDYEADNTKVNERDRHGSTLTPMDQGSSEADRKLTQQIRQGVVHDKTLSFTAKNVKIITLNGRVTLRGAVKTDAERQTIAATAKKIAGDAQVDNYLEVAK